jgi:acyl dehydratase
MPDSIGWDYAKVSGDFNPIHIAGFMAKAFGLPGKLVHGWYSVSMFASIIERIKNTQVNKIDVQFAKPVLMPTTVNIEYVDLSPTQTAFRITSVNKKGATTVHLTGTVG